MAITNSQIMEYLMYLGGLEGPLVAIEKHLAQLNGQVAANSKTADGNAEKLDDLPCTAHATDIVTLQAASASQATNWGRVAKLGLGLLQAVAAAVLIAWVMSQ